MGFALSIAIVAIAVFFKFDAIRDRIDDLFYSPPSAENVHYDPSVDLHIASMSNAVRIRRDLIRAIFNRDTLDFSMLPQAIEPADLLETGVNFDAPGAIWLVRDMGRGFVSKSLFLPSGKNVCSYSQTGMLNKCCTLPTLSPTPLLTKPISYVMCL